MSFILEGWGRKQLILEMVSQDGPAGRDSHVGPRSHSGANRDQYGLTVQVRFLTVASTGRGPSLTVFVQYGGTVQLKFLKYAVPSQA